MQQIDLDDKITMFQELDVSENAVGVGGSGALFAMLAENTTVEKLGNKALVNKS